LPPPINKLPAAARAAKGARFLCEPPPLFRRPVEHAHRTAALGGEIAD